MLSFLSPAKSYGGVTSKSWWLFTVKSSFCSRSAFLFPHFRRQLPSKYRHHGWARLQQPQQRRGGHGCHHVPSGGRCWLRRPRGLQWSALAFVKKLKGIMQKAREGERPPPSTRATGRESSVKRKLLSCCIFFSVPCNLLPNALQKRPSWCCEWNRHGDLNIGSGLPELQGEPEWRHFHNIMLRQW